jgi:hypothetical protein
MLSVNILSVIILSALILSVILLGIHMPSVVILIVIMLGIIMVSVIMLGVIMLNTVMLNVTMPHGSWRLLRNLYRSPPVLIKTGHTTLEGCVSEYHALTSTAAKQPNLKSKTRFMLPLSLSLGAAEACKCISPLTSQNDSAVRPWLGFPNKLDVLPTQR